MRYNSIGKITFTAGEVRVEGKCFVDGNLFCAWIQYFPSIRAFVSFMKKRI